MRHQFASSLIATPEGIFLNGMPLHKSAVRQQLSSRAARYIDRAGELLKQVKPERWDSRTPHNMNDVPALAKAQMMLALANPILLDKYSPDQPRDWHGRWTSDGADASTNADHTEEYLVADSGMIMSDAKADNGKPKAHILEKPEDHIGKSYPNAKGNTECVTFAQKVGGAPLTREWEAGDFISPENPPPKGTWVATFVNDKYYGHVGAFNGYDKAGNLNLIDQHNKKKKVSNSVYHVKDPEYRGHISNNPKAYRILKW